MYKKILALSLVSALVLTSCGTTTTTPESDTTSNDTSTTTSSQLSIVTTSFHEYDWMNEILGDDQDAFSLTFLNDDGLDLHSYQPTVADIATISSADLFIYNGSTSDTWVADVIDQATNPSFQSLCIFDVLHDQVMTEVTVEGMEETEHDHGTEETEDDHDHEEEAVEDDHDHEEEAVEDDHDHEEEAVEDDHDHEEEAVEDDHDHEEEAEEDEHIWLSLDNAMLVCQRFADVVCELDPDNAATYEANLASYLAELTALDSQYQEMVAAASRDTVIFADRFPFLYMMTDYNINYFAAFQGCSAETEASFETVIFLAETINTLDSNYVFIIDNGLTDLAATIIANSNNSDCQVLTLNSMQSISQDDVAAGATYLSIMQDNLAALTLALGE